MSMTRRKGQDWIYSDRFQIAEVALKAQRIPGGKGDARSDAAPWNSSGSKTNLRWDLVSQAIVDRVVVEIQDLGAMHPGQSAQHRRLLCPTICENNLSDRNPRGVGEMPGH